MLTIERTTEALSPKKMEENNTDNKLEEGKSLVVEIEGKNPEKRLANESSTDTIVQEPTATITGISNDSPDGFTEIDKSKRLKLDGEDSTETRHSKSQEDEQSEKKKEIKEQEVKKVEKEEKEKDETKEQEKEEGEEINVVIVEETKPNPIITTEVKQHLKHEASQNELELEQKGEVSKKDEQEIPNKDNSETVASSSDSTSSDVPGELYEKQGIKEGALVRVKWDVVDDQTEEEKAVWFSGCLKKFTGFDDQKRPMFQLDYDELNEFPACSKPVCFTTDGDMYDLDDKEFMAWLFQGSDFDENLVKDQELCATDIVQEQMRLDVEHGSVLDASMNAFKSLPHAKQMSMAIGYRTLADKVKQKLREIQQKNGEDYVITTTEITSIFNDITKKNNSEKDS